MTEFVETLSVLFVIVKVVGILLLCAIAFGLWYLFFKFKCRIAAEIFAETLLDRMEERKAEDCASERCGCTAANHESRKQDTANTPA